VRDFGHERSPHEPVERHLEVSRTARYALADGGAPLRELWIVLHGYRQLASRFLRRFTSLATGGRWIVAPEALNRFYLDDRPGRHGPGSPVGATWMTREDREHEIADYVAYLDRLHAHLAASAPAAPPVGVLGFSQGVHTAARWVAAGAVRPARVVLWGSYLPEDLDPVRATARLGGTDLVFVRGRSDHHRRADLEAEHLARVRDLGLHPRIVDHEGGHALDEALLADLLAPPLQNSPTRPISGTNS
jgi:predicted esterase